MKRLSVCAILVVVLTVALTSCSQKRAAKSVGVGDPISSEEEKRIVATIIDSYRLMGVADRTLDTSKFDTVFINDPRFPLRVECFEEVQRAFGEIPEGARYLTYIEAWYKNWERGALLLKEAREKVKAEGQENLTREEWESIKDKLGFFPAPPRTWKMPEGWEDWFRFYEFKIKGDEAMVLFDDGGSLRRAWLVKKEGKWYIADRILLEVHG